MQTTLQQAKAALRQQIGAKLKQIRPETRQAGSAQARTLLEAQQVWQKAQSILFFAPMAEELDVWSLVVAAVTAGKLVGLPRFEAHHRCYVACQVQDLARDVQTGYYGIREPTQECAQLNVNRLDLILVPGVAFDLHGRRLGRGKGYYDQLLAVLHGKTCGVAFDEQIVDEVPVEPHDVHLNCILTPTRWIEFSGCR